MCARLYVSGLGYYEAYLNGRRIGDYVLDPGWTDYRDRVFYSTFDVTPFLQKDLNCIGVMVGNGWYNPLPMRMWGRLNLRDHLSTGRPRFIAQLNIEFTGGSAQSIASSTDWRVHEGPVVRNNIYLGEVYDARSEIQGWSNPGLDDSQWCQAALSSDKIGPLQAQPQPPLKITAEVKPVEIMEPQPGIFIFDFGQNFAGWIRLCLKAKAGTKVTLRYGELLYPNGTLNPMTSVCGQIKGKRKDGTNTGGSGSPEIAMQSDVYIAKGAGEEIYTPRFTFHGFRYVELTGFPGKPSVDTLTGLRINSAVHDVGSFVCSNTLFNQIQEMVRRTFLSNIFSVQSDCPHRERFGYGGDLVVTSDAFMLNFDMATFYSKAVCDWHDAALADGMLTDTAPFVGIQYCGVAWAIAHPLLLYQLYQYYGNRRLIEEQYPTAKRWLDLIALRNQDHIIRKGLSDHEGLEPAQAPQMVTPLYYQSARLLSRLAAILGYEEDQKKYAGLAEDIKRAYNTDFMDPERGGFDQFTQASQAFALYLNLVPQRDQEAALNFLIKKIQEEHKGHLSTGIFGTKFLLDVLSRSGNAGIAYGIVNQNSFPGWGYMLERGGTTLWEHWDFSDNTYSHNHPMFGSVSEWFYKWLGGIQPYPKAVGFDRIIIRPQFVEDLEWVKAEYHSIRGKIRSLWHYKNGIFHLQVSIPPNTTAVVYVPSKDVANITESGIPVDRARGVRFLRMDKKHAVFKIVSGSYEFSSQI